MTMKLLILAGLLFLPTYCVASQAAKIVLPDEYYGDASDFDVADEVSPGDMEDIARLERKHKVAYYSATAVGLLFGLLIAAYLYKVSRERRHRAMGRHSCGRVRPMWRKLHDHRRVREYSNGNSTWHVDMHPQSTSSRAGSLNAVLHRVGWRPPSVVLLMRLETE